MTSTILIWLLAAAPASDVTDCSAGKKDACVRAAETAKAARRWADVKDLLARACALRDGASCWERAEFADDMFEAAEFRDKGCKAGDMLSCELYGKQLQQGYGAPKNEKAGTALIEKACKGGAGGACRALAFADTKSPRYVPLLEQACAAGDFAVSCLVLGDLLAEGTRVKADPVRAREMWTKACSPIQPKACDKAGIPVPPLK